MKSCKIAVMAVAAVAAGLLGTASCARTPAAGDRGAGGGPSESAADYYPLAKGWRWAYQLDKGGERMLAFYAVVERIEDTAVIQAGEERLAYAVTPEGIARRDGMRVADFVLKNPVRAGATWAIEGGEAKIADVGKTVTTPAGDFPNCATVEEKRTNPDRVVRTVYAAGVGPVSIEMRVQDVQSGSLEVSVRGALVGVTRPGEDPLKP